MKMRIIHLTCVFWMVTAASATVLYTTNDANDSEFGTPCGSPLTYNCINANAIGPAESFTAVSESFSPAVTALLGQIEVPVDAISGVGNLVVEITSDGGGIPGPIVKESLSATAPATASLVTLTSILHPTLTAGTTYWIVVTTSGTLNINWFVASDLNLRSADFFSSGSWNASSGSTKGSAEVDGLAPEPSSVALAAMGIAFFVIQAKRRS
jgi:hypothetical protein